MIFKFTLKSDSEHIIEAVCIIIAVALLLGFMFIEQQGGKDAVDYRDNKKALREQ